jgi:hypothetical protein
MEKLQLNRTNRARGRLKMLLERWTQIPNFRGVRVHVSTGYNRVEGTRRASRNDRVSDLPNVTIPSLYTLSLNGHAQSPPRRCSQLCTL